MSFEHLANKDTPKRPTETEDIDTLLRRRRKELQERLERFQKDLPSSRFALLGQARVNLFEEYALFQRQHPGQSLPEMEADLQKESELQHEIDNLEADLVLELSEHRLLYEHERKTGGLSSGVIIFEKDHKTDDFSSTKTLLQIKGIDRTLISDQLEITEQMERSFQYLLIVSNLAQNQLSSQDQQMLKAMYADRLGIEPVVVREFDGEEQRLKEEGLGLSDLATIGANEIQLARKAQRRGLKIKDCIRQYGKPVAAAMGLLAMFIDASAQQAQESMSHGSSTETILSSPNEMPTLGRPSFPHAILTTPSVELLAQTVALSTKDAETILKTVSQNQPMSSIPKFKQALLVCADQKPDVVMSTVDLWKQEPFAEEILLRTASIYPRVVMERAHHFKTQPYAPNVILKASQHQEDGAWAIALARCFNDQPYAIALFREIAARNPLFIITGIELGKMDLAIYNLNRTLDIQKELKQYKKESDIPPEVRQRLEKIVKAIEDKSDPIPPDIVRHASLAFAQQDPEHAIERMRLLQDKPFAKEMWFILAEKEPQRVLIELSVDENKVPYLEEVCRHALEHSTGSNTWIVFENASKFKDKSWMKPLIHTAILKDPELAIVQMFLNANEQNGKIVQQLSLETLTTSTDPSLRALQSILQSSIEQPVKKNMAALIDAMVRRSMTLEEAQRIATNPRLFLPAVLEVATQQHPIFHQYVEQVLQDSCLREVNRLNQNHELSDTQRFASVDQATAEEFYALMVYGEDEVFTSTFNGLYGRMMDRMQKQTMNGVQLLERMHNLRWRTFVKLCTAYNHLSEFLATMTTTEQQQILTNFLSKLEAGPDALSEAITIADTLDVVLDPSSVKLLSEQLKKEFERVSKERNSIGRTLYGLLAATLADRVQNEAWYRDIQKQYPLPHVSAIPAESLFSKEGANVQQYFFYNDADGHDTFQQFFNQYTGAGWEIDEQGSYIRISSKGKGKTLIIFANKPDAENGVDDIEKAMNKEKLVAQVIVHRGHSYHVNKTISHIGPSAAIVALGSCGGYNSIERVLDKSPMAHIISTKGTGTVRVNEILFRMLNENIRSGKDIVWKDFWTQAQERLGDVKDFSNYIPPDKNQGVLFLRAYRALTSQKQ